MFGDDNKPGYLTTMGSISDENLKDCNSGGGAKRSDIQKRSDQKRGGKRSRKSRKNKRKGSRKSRKH